VVRVFAILLLLFVNLSAKTLHAKYHVEYGVIGKVADINVSYRSDTKHYRIDAFVAAYGRLANLITHHLREHHISTGSLQSVMHATDHYEMHKRYGKYKSNTIYRTNIKRATLIRTYKLYENGKFKFTQTKKLPYFSMHDLLTFFLDLPKLIEGTKMGSCKTFRVVGADRKNGRVDVCLPSSSNINRYKKLLDMNATGNSSLFYAKVIMYRKLYHSKQGELEIAIDRDGIVHKAVLEDVLFFGDVRIVLDEIKEDRKR